MLPAYMSLTQPVANVRTAALPPGGDGFTMRSLASAPSQPNSESPPMTSECEPLRICRPLNRSGNCATIDSVAMSQAFQRCGGAEIW